MNREATVPSLSWNSLKATCQVYKAGSPAWPNPSLSVSEHFVAVIVSCHTPHYCHRPLNRRRSVVDIHN